MQNSPKPPSLFSLLLDNHERNLPLRHAAARKRRRGEQ
ncbi:hypothetical protein EKO27_g8319, partial [Xylaria grammica]